MIAIVRAQKVDGAFKDGAEDFTRFDLVNRRIDLHYCSRMHKWDQRVVARTEYAVHMLWLAFSTGGITASISYREGWQECCQGKIGEPAFGWQQWISETSQPLENRSWYVGKMG